MNSSTLSDPYSALRLRSFQFYLSSAMIGNIGYRITMVALSYELFGRTGGDYMSLGWLGLVASVPVFLMTLPAGQIADTYNRKKVVITGMFIASLGSLLLFLISYKGWPIWMSYACIMIRATTGTLANPARQALLPGVVPNEKFANAVTWSSSGTQLAMLIGPALGGIIASKSVPMAYLADATCMILSVTFMSLISESGDVRRREPATWETVVAGLRYVFHTKVILAAITLDLMATIFGGATALLPGFARDILFVDATCLGWLTAAPACGAVAMAALLAHVPPIQKAGRAMIIAVIGFGAATIAFGVSKNYYWSFFFLFLTGAFDNISVVVRHTLVQALAPDEMRGRISAVNTMFIGASNRLSDFESGVTAKLMGPVGSAVFGGLGSIISVVLAAIHWPELRRIGALSDLTPEQPDAAPAESEPIAAIAASPTK